MMVDLHPSVGDKYIRSLLLLHSFAFAFASSTPAWVRVLIQTVLEGTRHARSLRVYRVRQRR